MIHRLQALGTLDMTLVDVGARGGIQGYWPVFKNLRLIGFEPDAAELEKLSGGMMLPYILDSESRKRKMYVRSHNHAANGLYPISVWWGMRFASVGVAGDYKAALSGRLPAEHVATEDVVTETFNAVAKRHEIGNVDFMKVDAEGAELDIVKGGSDYLHPRGILGFELEVRFLPSAVGSPLFHEVCAFMAQAGYSLYDLDMHRGSRAALPLPVGADHRDHNDKPLMFGDNIGGQVCFGDALFMRDLIADGFGPEGKDDLHRIIRVACLFELFGLPDCAAELLLYYRASLTDWDVDDLLAYLVPGDKPMHYADYIRSRSSAE